MGETTEMMLDGTLDYITGEYLGEPCGYPRSQEDGTYYRDRSNLQRRATQSLRDMCRVYLGITDLQMQDMVVYEFLKAIGLARIPKKRAQYEMVFLHYRKDFRIFLREIKTDI